MRERFAALGAAFKKQGGGTLQITNMKNSMSNNHGVGGVKNGTRCIVTSLLLVSDTFTLLDMGFSLIFSFN